MTDKSSCKSLDYLRMHYIDELRIAMQQLKNVAEQSLRKIENEGISGYYSCNSDVGRYSEKAWRASWALGEMKRLESKLSDEHDKAVEEKLTMLLESCTQSNKNKEESTEKK